MDVFHFHLLLRAICNRNSFSISLSIFFLFPASTVTLVGLICQLKGRRLRFGAGPRTQPCSAVLLMVNNFHSGLCCSLLWCQPLGHPVGVGIQAPMLAGLECSPSSLAAGPASMVAKTRLPVGERSSQCAQVKLGLVLLMCLPHFGYDGESLDSRSFYCTPLLYF